MKKRNLEQGELVGGPYDGQIVFVMGHLLLSFNLYVYRRSTRLSKHGKNIYCFDHVGHRSEKCFQGQDEF
jgi:hypothetical protein